MANVPILLVSLSSDKFFLVVHSKGHHLTVFWGKFCLLSFSARLLHLTPSPSPPLPLPHSSKALNPTPRRCPGQPIHPASARRRVPLLVSAPSPRSRRILSLPDYFLVGIMVLFGASSGVDLLSDSFGVW